eukprot:COSAG01_NODE_7190_length_3311_cov_113.791407_3_plen_93_part_00
MQAFLLQEVRRAHRETLSAKHPGRFGPVEMQKTSNRTAVQIQTLFQVQRSRGSIVMSYGRSLALRKTSSGRNARDDARLIGATILVSTCSLA